MVQPWAWCCVRAWTPEAPMCVRNRSWPLRRDYSSRALIGAAKTWRSDWRRREVEFWLARARVSFTRSIAYMQGLAALCTRILHVHTPSIYKYIACKYPEEVDCRFDIFRTSPARPNQVSNPFREGSKTIAFANRPKMHSASRQERQVWLECRKVNIFIKKFKLIPVFSLFEEGTTYALHICKGLS